MSIAEIIFVSLCTVAIGVLVREIYKILKGLH